MLQFAAVLAETEEHLAPLIMPPLAFVAIAVVFFLALGFVTWSFRDVSNRGHKRDSSHGSGH
jgi:hypothetical protein